MGRKKKPRLPDLEKYLKTKKRHLVTYADGARMYKVPYYTFVHLAKDANAYFVAKKTAIVELELFEEYLDQNPAAAERVERLRRFDDD